MFSDDSDDSEEEEDSDEVDSSLRRAAVFPFLCYSVQNSPTNSSVVLLRFLVLETVHTNPIFESNRNL